MKEPFVSLDTLIDQTQLLSDMELQSYLANLSSSQRTDFVVSNVRDVMDNVEKTKSQRYVDMADQISGADNNITSAAYYLARTDDLKNLASDVDTLTLEQLNVADLNKEVIGRQYEINEWSNQNKLDTLYFLQLLFVILTFVSMLLFLKTNNLISQSLFALLTTLAGLFAVFVLVFRARYTKVVRDDRYWHKARFPRQHDPFPLQVKTGPTCLPALSSK